MSFRNAFAGTDVESCIMPGIQALESHTNLIITKNPVSFEASVNIDSCLERKYPNQNRWDYAFGYRKRIYYVEVHSAKDSEVKVVIAKYNWLINWQNEQDDPKVLKKNCSYHWISSGKIAISKKSHYFRQLTKVGLSFPVKKLSLNG